MGAVNPVFCTPARREQGGSGRCPWDEHVGLGGRAKAHLPSPVCLAVGTCSGAAVRPVPAAARGTARRGCRGEGAGYFAERCSQIGDQFGLSCWACDRSLLYEVILVERTSNNREAILKPTNQGSGVKCWRLRVTGVGNRAVTSRPVSAVFAAREPLAAGLFLTEPEAPLVRGV